MITWSTYKISVGILRLPLRGIVESRNPPTPAITREQWELQAKVLSFSAVEGLEGA